LLYLGYKQTTWELKMGVRERTEGRLAKALEQLKRVEDLISQVKVKRGELMDGLNILHRDIIMDINKFRERLKEL
jgi:hypothetical protein